MKIENKIKQEILKTLFKSINSNECSVFLFGSYARANARQSSDIDVGIVCTYSISFDTILRIKDELNETVNILRDIDLVDFTANLDPEFKRIALKDIQIWYKTKESEEILSSIRRHLIH